MYCVKKQNKKTNSFQRSKGNIWRQCPFQIYSATGRESCIQKADILSYRTNSADKSVKNMACYRIPCPPKIFVCRNIKKKTSIPYHFKGLEIDSLITRNSFISAIYPQILFRNDYDWYFKYFERIKAGTPEISSSGSPVSELGPTNVRVTTVVVREWRSGGSNFAHHKEWSAHS